MLSERFGESTTWASNFSDMVKKAKAKSAVKSQVEAAAALPSRIIQRNLIAADSIVRFCAEVMGAAAPSFKDMK